MRTMILVAAVTACLVFSADRGRAQSGSLHGGIFFAPNSARSVSLSKNGVLVASFNVPKGMFLSASYDDQRPNSITAGRWEFHGDIAVRVQPASAVRGRQPGKTLELVTGDATLILTGQDLDIVIENVELSSNGSVSVSRGAANRRLRVGGAVRAPMKLVDVKPVYPDDARAAGIEGVIVLDIVIGEDGSVIEARVLRSIPQLDQAAIDAVRQWKFEPTLLNGEPVEIEMNVTVSFTVR
jgi:TonB family protein